MSSFKNITAVAAIALFTAASAGPVISARADTNPLAHCWGNGNSGTDGNVNLTDKCKHAGDTTFPTYANAAQALDSFPGQKTTVDTHTTLGPWHCCSVCDNDSSCVGWEIAADCTCTIWKNSACPAGQGVYTNGGSIAGNQTSTFHPNKCF